MKFLADIHTHSLASGHAYSTIDENVRAAAEKGLEWMALTEHGPAMQNTTSHAYFANLHVIPKALHGVQLLKGIELNILDFEGTVDMDERMLAKLDIAIASLHVPCIAPGSRKENTNACIKAIENPWIDILGHLGDPRYDMDYEAIFDAARAHGTLLEVNNASLVPNGFRSGSEENIEKLLQMAKKESVPIVVGSDAHFYTGVGDFSYAKTLLEKTAFPEELILNTDPKRLLAHLKRRRM